MTVSGLGFTDVAKKRQSTYTDSELSELMDSTFQKIEKIQNKVPVWFTPKYRARSIDSWLYSAEMNAQGKCGWMISASPIPIVTVSFVMLLPVFFAIYQLAQNGVGGSQNIPFVIALFSIWLSLALLVVEFTMRYQVNSVRDEVTHNKERSLFNRVLYRISSSHRQFYRDYIDQRNAIVIAVADFENYRDQEMPSIQIMLDEINQQLKDTEITVNQFGEVEKQDITHVTGSLVHS